MSMIHDQMPHPKYQLHYYTVLQQISINTALEYNIMAIFESGRGIICLSSSQKDISSVTFSKEKALIVLLYVFAGHMAALLLSLFFVQYSQYNMLFLLHRYFLSQHLRATSIPLVAALTAQAFKQVDTVFKELVTILLKYVIAY